jgi:uncharacterized coiled-coil DUF342 family protein
MCISIGGVFLLTEDAAKKKEEIEQLRNSEKKYQALIQRRNELNDAARVIREERDLLNGKRKELRDQMDVNKKERDDFVTQMKQHKEIRNKLQQQAKDLIQKKRKKKGDFVKNLPLRFEELKADIQMMEYRQETTPMSTHDENELIKKIKEKRREFKETQKQMQKQQVIEVDITDTDNAITELFKKADEEHALVQKFYDDSQKKHDEYMKLVKEIATLINESNKKHKEYLEMRTEAQDNHDKANEMRSKIVSIKKERRSRIFEDKEILRQQNLQARKSVLDKDKLEKVADESVDELKKGRKISLS